MEFTLISVHQFRQGDLGRGKEIHSFLLGFIQGLADDLHRHDGTASRLIRRVIGRLRTARMDAAGHDATDALGTACHGVASLHRIRPLATMPLGRLRWTA